MSKVTVTDKKSPNWIQIEKNIRDLKGKEREVFIGILEEDFGKQHGEGGATVGEVATYNEFGTESIPARSFIRAPFDEKQGYEKLAKSLLKRVFMGVISVESALNILGSGIAKSFLKTIKDGIDPPNAEATIDRKFSDTPLVDSGEMRDYITYKIIK